MPTVAFHTSKILAFGTIVRPSNVVLFFLAILLGAFVTSGISAFEEPKVWLAAISGTLVGAAANVINDVMDMEIDRINKPKTSAHQRCTHCAGSTLVLACAKCIRYLDGSWDFSAASDDCHKLNCCAIRLQCSAQTHRLVRQYRGVSSCKFGTNLCSISNR